MVFRNAGYAHLFLFALSGLAFWPRYLSRPGASIDLYTHGHAVLAAGWCMLLIAQPLLATGDRRAHRYLGRTSYLLAPAFVVASVLLAHFRFRAMDDATFRREAASLFLPFQAILLFAACFGLAVCYRRALPLHARFMILTGLPMLDPVLGRILYFYAPALPHPLHYQVITFGITDLAVAVLLFCPPTAGRIRWTYGVAAAVFPVMHALWFTVAQGPAWVPVASWFRDLPLP